jgi:hypothetical protein
MYVPCLRHVLSFFVCGHPQACQAAPSSLLLRPACLRRKKAFFGGRGKAFFYDSIVSHIFHSEKGFFDFFHYKL